jgi:hypothetical protein
MLRMLPAQQEALEPRCEALAESIRRGRDKN